MGEKSTKEYLDEFILYKHSLGYVYDTQSYYLKRYAAFEETNYPGSLLSKEAADSYLATIGDQPGTLYGTVCVMREFSRYLQKQGIPAYVFPAKTVRQQTPEPPYFFTEEELCRFFSLADAVEPLPGYPGRELIIPAFFRLMYCCGIRCREARMLRCEQISCHEKYMDILQSKGPKDRRLYISDELADYLRAYDQKISTLYPAREYFFPGYRGHPHVSESFVCGNFHRLWNQAFPGSSSEVRPRAYDLRHHFAWTNINRWALGGLDVNAMLPYLMRYMGHASVKQTLYYFHFVPEFYSDYSGMAEPSEDILPEVPE